MKKEYIKPIIINIKIYNDDALCQMKTASLFDMGNDKSVETIAGEGEKDEPDIGDGGFIWND